MKHKFRWIALAVGVLVAALAVVLAVNVDTDPRAEFNTSRLVGKPAPTMELTRFDGTPLGAADFAGKVVLVNFWNSWCVPCNDELPALQQWYTTHRDDPDLVMVGVPRDDTASAIRQAATDDRMAWAVAENAGARAATLAYGTRGQPETYVVSPSGVVVGSLFGPANVEQLDLMLERARKIG